MSDLFGNHIVGFPTRRLNFDTWSRNLPAKLLTDIATGPLLCVSVVPNTSHYGEGWGHGQFGVRGRLCKIAVNNGRAIKKE